MQFVANCVIIQKTNPKAKPMKVGGAKHEPKFRISMEYGGRAAFVGYPYYAARALCFFCFVANLEVIDMSLKSVLTALSLKAKIVISAVAVAAVGTAVTAAVILTGSTDTYRVLKVFELSGSAVISREGTGKLDAYVGMNLESGDTLTVNDDSTMRISMDNDKYVQLEGGTVLELVAEGTAADSRTSIKLKKGTILNELTSSLSANSSYEVSTPKSTMAVRGTSFLISVEENEDGSYNITTQTFHGKVEVILLDSEGNPTDKRVIVTEDNCVIVRTVVNDETGNPAEIDGISFFAVEIEDGVYVEVPYGESPLTGIDYSKLSESIKHRLLNSSESGVLVLNKLVEGKLRGEAAASAGDDNKATEATETTTTLPDSEPEETTTTEQTEDTTITTTVTTVPESSTTATTVTTVPVSETTPKTAATTVPTSETTKKTTKKTKKTTKTEATTTTTEATTTTTEATTTTAETTVTTSETTVSSTTTTTPAWVYIPPVITEEEPPVSETYTINYVLASNPSVVVATQPNVNYGDPLDASLLPVAFDVEDDGTYDYYLFNTSQISGTVTGNSTIPVTYEEYDSVYEVKFSNTSSHYLVLADSEITLPSTADPVSGYTFVGWGVVTSGGYSDPSVKIGSDSVTDNDPINYYCNSIPKYDPGQTISLSGVARLGGNYPDYKGQNYKFAAIYGSNKTITIVDQAGTECGQFQAPYGTRIDKSKLVETLNDSTADLNTITWKCNDSIIDFSTARVDDVVTTIVADGYTKPTG